MERDQHHSSRALPLLLPLESNKLLQQSLLQPVPPPSRYEAQKRRDWNTFGQYLRSQRPPVPLSRCDYSHVIHFLRYLDQFGKTKVHLQGCVFYGQPEPPTPCPCPLRQAWGSLDALIGRLRAAYEESGGAPESNPFAVREIRVYLREVKECQVKARGIPHKKKKRAAAAAAAPAMLPGKVPEMGAVMVRERSSSSSCSSSSRLC